MNHKIISKISRIAGIYSLSLFLLAGHFFIKGLYQPERSPHFIFWPDTGQQYEEGIPFINKLQETGLGGILGLPGIPPAPTRLRAGAVTGEALDAIADHPQHQPVIIAIGDQAPKVAEITQRLAEREDGKKIHSIIFLNPQASTKKGWFAVREAPLEFNYPSIINRIYSFYSKAPYWTIPPQWRKIQPELSDGETPYTRAINILCYYNEADGSDKAFSFFPEKDYGINPLLLGNYASSITRSIEQINNRFRLNWDLAAVLLTQVTPTPPPDIFPLIFINRPVELRNENLENRHEEWLRPIPKNQHAYITTQLNRELEFVENRLMPLRPLPPLPNPAKNRTIVEKILIDNKIALPRSMATFTTLHNPVNGTNRMYLVIIIRNTTNQFDNLIQLRINNRPYA